MEDLKLKIAIIIAVALLLSITFVLIQLQAKKRKTGSNSSNAETVNNDFRGDGLIQFKKSELSVEQRKKIIKVVLLTGVFLVVGLIVHSYLKKRNTR